MTIDAIQALGEPNRRAILERLCEREHTVSELVPALSLSQPAVSQHLRVLLDAGLVSVRREGRRRVYRAEPEGLRRVHEAIEQYWRASLRQMQQELGEPARPHRADAPPGRERHDRR